MDFFKSMSSFLFYFFAALAVLSGIFVITASKPTRALLSLILTMFSLAVIYLFMGAYFVAMAHLIVYAGAVLVLFLFVIMLQGAGAREIPLLKRFGPMQIIAAGLTGTAMLTLLISVLVRSLTGAEPTGIHGDTRTFGLALFKEYLLPFELTSILILVGVFSAVTLAKKDPEDSAS